MDFAARLSQKFSIKLEYVANILKLLEDGNTIPFIARYRKEMHGTQDDQTIREIAESYESLKRLEETREDTRSKLEALGVLTDELNAALNAAETVTEINDIYLPYRPKRRTRATVAKEKGLGPLAEAIFAQENNGLYPVDMAKDYVDPEKGVETVEDALAGAYDIIAEMISDNASIRKRLRYVVFANGSLVSKAVDPEKDSVYTTYYSFSEKINKIAGYRVLAINRGEAEDFLRVSVEFDDSKGLRIVYSESVKGESPCRDAVTAAAEDAYSRLIFPAIERDVRRELTETATEGAIKNFSANLRQLLMQPPAKGKTVLGLDPGYRTGCKVAVIDPTGRVLDTSVVYCTLPNHNKSEAERVLTNLIKKHKVNAIAIGNGTASKETEMFTADLLGKIGGNVGYMVVSEAGASVYSASKLAAAEFPEYDVSLRSAVSIARRLEDPLAELVKIDPKSIGVGQYQHDMPEKQLDEALGGVVEGCVNTVGVDLNTASPSLLSYVAGVSGAVSKNIVAYREENGAFKSRKELLKVAKLGPKAFEQCAGFLRVPESRNLLDNTAVHPESYEAAERLLERCGCQITSSGVPGLANKIGEIGIEKLARELSVGVPTLTDIVTELSKPGRDPRDELPAPMLRTDVLSMSDLKPGMEMKGTVRNVIDFGAFVDIGVHQDGLVHVSEICNTFIKHPSEKLKVGQVVDVWVLSVDEKKGRISLTMKGDPTNDPRRKNKGTK